VKKVNEILILLALIALSLSTFSPSSCVGMEKRILFFDAYHSSLKETSFSNPFSAIENFGFKVIEGKGDIHKRGSPFTGAVFLAVFLDSIGPIKDQKTLELCQLRLMNCKANWFSHKSSLILEAEEIKRVDELIDGARKELVRGNYVRMMKVSRSVEILMISFSSLRTQMELGEKVACFSFMSVPALLSFFLIKNRRKRKDLFRDAAISLKKALEEVVIAKEEGVDVSEELNIMQKAVEMLDQAVQKEEDFDKKLIFVEGVCKGILRNLRSERLARRICLVKMSNFSKKLGRIIDKAIEARNCGFLGEEISRILDHLSEELQLVLKEFKDRKYKKVIKRLDMLKEPLEKLQETSMACLDLMSLYQREWKPKIGKLIEDATRTKEIPIEHFSFIPKELREPVLSEIAPKDFEVLRLDGDKVVIRAEESPRIEKREEGKKVIGRALLQERKLNVEESYQLNKAKEIIRRACMEEASNKLKEQDSVSRVRVNLRCLEEIDEKNRRVAIRGFIAEMLMKYGIRCFVSGDWLVIEGDLRNLLVEDIKRKR